MIHITMPAYSEPVVYPVPPPKTPPPKNWPGSYVKHDPEIEGWIGDDERQWLYDKAHGMRVIVEIGSWMGRSTHALLSGCRGTVYAVDHFNGSPSEVNGAHSRARNEDIGAIFLKNVGQWEHLKLLRMPSLEAVKQFPDQSVDMVWIDGGHDYDRITADIAAWWPKCRVLMCGHDANQDGVPQALKEFEAKYNTTIKRGPSAIWYIERAAL